MIIAGDFNASHPKWSKIGCATNNYGHKTARLIDNHGLSLKTLKDIGTFSNHLTHYPTTIDLLLTTSNLDAKTSTIQLRDDILNDSDHNPWCFTITLEECIPLQSHTMKLFKKADYCDIIRPHLKKELENLDTTVFITNPPQVIFDQFTSILNSNIAHIPEKVIKTKYLAKWWNEDLPTARNKCNNARRNLQHKKKKTKRRRTIKALDKEIKRNQSTC